MPIFFYLCYIYYITSCYNFQGLKKRFFLKFKKQLIVFVNKLSSTAYTAMELFVYFQFFSEARKVLS